VSSKLTRQEQGVTLLARMNLVLDFPEKYFPEIASRLRFAKSRPLRKFLRGAAVYQDGRFNPVFGLDHLVVTNRCTSWSYNWRGALACTSRSFVHLLTLKKQGSAPDLFLGCRLPDPGRHPRARTARVRNPSDL